MYLAFGISVCVRCVCAGFVLTSYPPPPPPQLYVDGEFIGGCDIVTGMHASGELKSLLANVPRAPLA